MLNYLLRVKITDLVKQGHYQLACGRYFDAKHKSETKFAPQHPNQYYDESRRLLAEDGEGMSAYATVFSETVFICLCFSCELCNRPNPFLIQTH